MFDLIQRFIYMFISLQSKKLKHKEDLKASCSNSTTKVVLGDGSSLKLSLKTEQNKEKLQVEVSNILQKSQNNPKKILAFVKNKGTSVYRIPFAKKILGKINAEEGFVCSQSGLSALYLSLVLSVFSKEGCKISFNTEPIFVFDTSELDKYLVIQHFHKWYSMKLKLPGLDYKSQKNFNEIFKNASSSKINDLDFDEIIGLKEAIARDVESVNFVISLIDFKEGPKDAMKKIASGGATV